MIRLLATLLLLPFTLAAQTAPAPPPASNSPATLPGRGLTQHDMLYCGEWNFNEPLQTIWIVRGGKPVWSYSIPFHIQFGGKEDFQETRRLHPVGQRQYRLLDPSRRLHRHAGQEDPVGAAPVVRPQTGPGLRDTDTRREVSRQSSVASMDALRGGHGSLTPSRCWAACRCSIVLIERLPH
jgi:hypothetical protein